MDHVAISGSTSVWLHQRFHNDLGARDFDLKVQSLSLIKTPSSFSDLRHGFDLVGRSVLCQ